MKVVFYPIYCSTPHFETELELMKDHLESDDDVFTFVCNGELKTCFFNPYHERILCQYCRSRVKRGLALLNHKNHKICKYPKINIDYSNIPDIFPNIDSLKQFSLQGISVGLAAASSLISRNNREHRLDTITFSSETNREIKNSYYLSQIFDRYIIPEIKPDLVYIFNGRISITAPVVDVCKKNNIRFNTHERGGQINSYWLIKDTIPHDVENVYREIEEVSGKLTNTEFNNIGSKFYIDRRNRVEQGWFSFTTAQRSNLLPQSLSESRTNIMIFNSTIEEFAAVKGWEKPLFLFEDEIDALSTILDHYKDDRSKMFYLRVHPNLKGFNNTQTRQLKELSEKFRNIELIAPESPIDSYSLLDKSDKVLTFGSTIGIEATYWNKPSIQLGMAFYNKTGSVYIPKTKEELYEMLDSNLAPLDRNGAYKYGIWELSRGIVFKYFKQTSLISGTFEGKKIESSYFWKLLLSLSFRLNLLKVKK
jgi:hypothetical protein